MDRTAQESAERNARTIDLLFQEMLRAKRNGARVKAAFDPKFGYPTRIYVDSERESWNLEMRSFEAIQ